MYNVVQVQRSRVTGSEFIYLREYNSDQHHSTFQGSEQIYPRYIYIHILFRQIYPRYIYICTYSSQVDIPQIYIYVHILVRQIYPRYIYFLNLGSISIFINCSNYQSQYGYRFDIKLQVFKILRKFTLTNDKTC